MTYRRGTDNTMAKRYQRVNQNMYIEEEQTTQWTKEKVQKDKESRLNLNKKHNVGIVLLSLNKI
jgi:hypothetical protein